MFILNKILAVYVGPSGYALIGQFQNFIQMVTVFSGNAINTAVVKYTAEYYEQPEKQRTIWQTATGIIFFFSLVGGGLIFLLREKLSVVIFNNSDYESVFIWFAVFLLFFNLNTLFLAILNGKKAIERLVAANISGSLISLAITAVLVIEFGLYGALVALAIYQSLAFFITFFICNQASWFSWKELFGNLDKGIARKFASFALMAVVSAVCVPVSQMVIRQYLSYEYGNEYAGYWEAMVRFSGAYLMLVTTTLGVYYLPRLSELKEVDKIKQEIFLAYKYIFPLALLGGVTVFILKDWIIITLFSDKFLPMRELFFWQILGDIVKIGSWILAYLMLSKAMTKLFVITEVVFSISSVLLSILFVNLIGFEGVSLAHLINYTLYLMVVGLFIFKVLNKL
ncbi:Polysaccharide biosynthesis protein [Mannheimia sp. USDA-ARS-USMARC-1261]|nr:Polysaccharide biosynthesis protein [Mannheimia sp. USDA-ARS-USMARC-1261]